MSNFDCIAIGKYVVHMQHASDATSHLLQNCVTSCMKNLLHVSDDR
jgi:hypothetical protein